MRKIILPPVITSIIAIAILTSAGHHVYYRDSHPDCPFVSRFGMYKHARHTWSVSRRLGYDHIYMRR